MGFLVDWNSNGWSRQKLCTILRKRLHYVNPLYPWKSPEEKNQSSGFPQKEGVEIFRDIGTITVLKLDGNSIISIVTVLSLHNNYLLKELHLYVQLPIYRSNQWKEKFLIILCPIVFTLFACLQNIIIFDKHCIKILVNNKTVWKEQ